MCCRNSFLYCITRPQNSIVTAGNKMWHAPRTTPTNDFKLLRELPLQLRGWWVFKTRPSFLSQTFVQATGQLPENRAALNRKDQFRQMTLGRHPHLNMATHRPTLLFRSGFNTTVAYALTHSHTLNKSTSAHNHNKTNAHKRKHTTLTHRITQIHKFAKRTQANQDTRRGTYRNSHALLGSHRT